MTNAWFILILAGLLEVGWAMGLKSNPDFTRPVLSVLTITAIIGSMWLLAQAMRHLPLGTAYSAWVGVGAVGTVALGILLRGEPATVGRLLSVALIVAGVIGLRLSEPS